MPPAHFELTREIQFAETDMAGVLHFSNYFRLTEEVEHAFWRSAGLSVVMPHDGAIYSWPRVKVSCEYLGPLRFEDTVTLALTFKRVGRKAIDFEVEFRRDGERTAVAHITAVCCRTQDATFESVEIPPFLRAPLDAAMASA